MPVMSQDFGRALKEYAQEGLRELGLELSPEAWERLELYFSLLREFGAPLGLTALKDPKDFAVKHLLDSLTVQPFLPEGPLLDLGTGAGLPGMVLKIVDPAREVWLVDARKKAISFLTLVAARLGLSGLKILKATVGKDPLPEGYFSAVVSRAVSDLGRLVELSRPLLRKEGILIAMKGPRVEEEIRALKAKEPDLELEVHRLRLPLTGDARSIVLVKGSPS